MNNFWDERYKSGGNSGVGSYGEYAKHKAEVINNCIIKYNIKTISDFGCGDGNQIGLLHGFESYIGCDISPHIISQCRRKFGNNSKMSFCSSMSELQESDLCLSLDVLYHIVDFNEFEKYLKLLFNKSKRYVLIFSSNHENNKHDALNYIYHRKFTNWIEENYNNFKLVEIVDNTLGTSAKFFLYEKMN